MAFRERLMGIVSHDLRSPLGAISVAAQTILAREAAPDWALPSALRVKRSVDRMARMISDLLDFTRVAAMGSLAVDLRPGDLRAPVKDAVDELDLSHPGRITLSLPAQTVEGTWDADRIEQVVTNLIANALHHGAPDGPIQVQLLEEGDQATLSVTNQGPVIKDEDLPILIDPFRKARTGSQTGGLGLGLHIVYEVVKAHGGTVDVTSDAQHGTTFTARFPKRPAHPGAPG